MSLASSVMTLMRRLECATVDDLCPHLPGYTRDQVMTAMQNARVLGLLTCEGHQPRRSAGGGRGSVPSTYRFVAMPTHKERQPRPASDYLPLRRRELRPRVASVFELAQHI
jgi:hypothetical protein